MTGQAGRCGGWLGAAAPLVVEEIIFFGQNWSDFSGIRSCLVLQ